MSRLRVQGQGVEVDSLLATGLARRAPTWSSKYSRFILGVFILFIALVLGLISTEPKVALVLIAVAGGALVAALVPVSSLLLVWPFSLVFWTPVVQIAGYNITLADLLTAVLWIKCVFFAGSRMWRRSLATVRRLLIIGVAPAVPLGIAGLLTFGLEGFITSIGLFFKRWGIYSIIPLAVAVDGRGNRKYEWSFVLASGLAMGLGVFRDLGIEGRASGVLFNPNTLGVFAVLGISMCVHLIAHTSGAERYAALAIAVPHFLALVLSGSREAWITLAVSMGYWAFHARSRKVVLLAVVMGLVALVLPIGEVSRVRLSMALAQGLNEVNVAGRLDATRAGLKLFMDYPLGVGAGKINAVGWNYLELYGGGDYSLYLLHEGFATTDNTYVDELIEGGILSLFFVLWTLYLMWRWTMKTGYGRAVVLCLMVAGLASATLHVPVLSGALWYVVALDLDNRWGERFSGSPQGPDNHVLERK